LKSPISKTHQTELTRSDSIAVDRESINVCLQRVSVFGGG